MNLRRLRALFRRDKLDADMRAEMAVHLDEQTQRNLAAGMSATDARAAAHRQFGGVAQIQEQARDQRAFRWIEDLLHDLRYGARVLARQPGFATVAVLTFALGVGVNTALFSVFDALMFRPLPLRDVEELVKLDRLVGGESRARGFSHADFVELRAASRTLADIAASTRVRRSLDDGRAMAPSDSIVAAGNTQFVPLHFVSANYLELLGARFVLGRGFALDDDRQPHAAAVAVLSHRFWQRYYRGDDAVLGKTLRLGNMPFTVIGVTAPEFVGADASSPAAWIPLSMHPEVDRWFNSRSEVVLQLVGRLAPDVSAAEARAELTTRVSRQAAEHTPGASPVAVRLDQKFTVLDASMLGEPFLLPLVAAFALVLAIACANVSNLLLARTTLRQQEMGVRLALGASRGRVMRQLLGETALLAALGGIAGFFFAHWTLAVLHTLVLQSAALPAQVRDWVLLDARPGSRVFVFSFGLALGAGVLAGLVPAWRASGTEVNRSLGHAHAGLGQRLGRSRFRDVLVVGQVAVCLALLIGAGLLVRYLQRASVHTNALPLDRVFNVHVPLHPANPDAPALRRQLAWALRQLPGVAAVSEAEFAPLLRPRAPFTRVVRTDTADAPALRAEYNFVGAEFFSTLGMDVLHGRGFTAEDATAGSNVIVVSETLARRLWPGTSPIGQFLGIEASALAEVTTPASPEAATSSRDIFVPYQVAGVVRDTRSGVMWHADPPFAYLPLAPASPRNNRILVRSVNDPLQIEESVRATALAITNSRVMLEGIGDRQAEQLAPFRALASLGGGIGLLAVLLATGGVFGVMSYTINARTREIGIRVALGATASEVVAHFVHRSLRLIGLGTLVGLVGGSAFWLVLGRMMPDLRAPDPLLFLGVAVGLASVTLIACWLPARRAAKVDPIVALRAE